MDSEEIKVPLKTSDMSMPAPTALELVEMKLSEYDKKYPGPEDDKYKMYSELSVAATCYITAARRQIRQKDADYVAMSMNDYPEVFGGREVGRRRMKATPKENLITAAALLIRDADRLIRLENSL